MKISTPTVLLHWAEDGSFTFCATEGVTIHCVDERCVGEREYSTVGAAKPVAIEAVFSGAVTDLRAAFDMANEGLN